MYMFVCISDSAVIVLSTRRMNTVVAAPEHSDLFLFDKYWVLITVIKRSLFSYNVDYVCHQTTELDIQFWPNLRISPPLATSQLTFHTDKTSHNVHLWPKLIFYKSMLHSIKSNIYLSASLVLHFNAC